jgi:hypothetical protein
MEFMALSHVTVMLARFTVKMVEMNMVWWSE